MAQEFEMAAAVCNRNASFFMKAASSLGLTLVFEGPFDQQHPPLTTGKKHTASSATPDPGSSMPVATRINPPCAVKKPSPASTPRGRPPTPSPSTLRCMEPSPTPHPKKAPPNLGTNRHQEQAYATNNLATHTPAPTAISSAPEVNPLIAAIQAAMAPLVARLDALKKLFTPPLPPHVPHASNQGRNAQAEKVRTSMSDELTNTPRPWPPPTTAGLTLWLVPEKPNPPAAATSSNKTDKPQGFLTVKHCRNRGGTAKKEGLVLPPSPCTLT